MDEGDWWCWLDSDEFYIDNPREFLATVPNGYGEVWSSSYQFYFTDVDAARYESDPEAFLATPVQERLRYYLNNWSESRFFRHHPGLVWPRNSQGRAFGNRPVGLGRVDPHRIRLRHYQFRSPDQIQYRLDIRATDPNFPHERREDWVGSVIGVPPRPRTLVVGAPSWQERIVPAYALLEDRGGELIPSTRSLPRLPVGRGRALKHWMLSVRWRITPRLRYWIERLPHPFGADPDTSGVPDSPAPRP